jgi:BlaI family transcriptional regulator, penicillinase repressor
MNAPGPNGNKKAASADPRRRSLLDLAPLELDCMNTLWPIGEGTVREIRDQLAPRRPRAYTTIMTIMDRLARKGIVERRKSGRAYVYRPTLSVEDARSHALGQIVESFFGGSRETAAAYLRDGTSREPDGRGMGPAMAAAAAASASAGLGRTSAAAPTSAPAPDGGDSAPVVERTPLARTRRSSDDETPIDATLL